MYEKPELPKYSGQSAPQLVFEKDLTIPLEGKMYSFDVSRDGTMFALAADTGEIGVYDMDGKLIRTIKKRAQPIKTTKSDLDCILKEYPGLREFQDSLILSGTKPFFSDFHLLEGIGLLVSSYENEWDDKGVIFCDLFDPEGVYLAKVTVPRYFYWNHHELIVEQRNRLFKNGNCYSICYNQENDFLELVRHRVSLISPRPSQR